MCFVGFTKFTLPEINIQKMASQKGNLFQIKFQEQFVSFREGTTSLYLYLCWVFEIKVSFYPPTASYRIFPAVIFFEKHQLLLLRNKKVEESQDWIWNQWICYLWMEIMTTMQLFEIWHLGLVLFDRVVSSLDMISSILWMTGWPML